MGTADAAEAGCSPGERPGSHGPPGGRPVLTGNGHRTRDLKTPRKASEEDTDSASQGASALQTQRQQLQTPRLPPDTPLRTRGPTLTFRKGTRYG